MRGTNCAESFASIQALPAEALALLDQAPGLFAGRPWWQVVLAHAMPPGAQASFVVVRFSHRIVALLPMLHQAAAPHPDGRLSSLTTPYTCEYTPLFAAGLDVAARVTAMAVFAEFCRPFGVVRLDALPAEWPGLPQLQAGARQAGLRTLRFEHFGNWYQDVAGLDWSGYLLGRTGALRETVKRRLRRAEKLPHARFDLLTAPAQMDQAAAAFEAVYRRSWKQPEPYPAFNVALMRAMAALGTLRFGIWSIGTDPVAAQLWVVKDDRAIVLKLAHDEAFKAHSPGTVLTALMLRHLLQQEHVAQIDFGRGDDAYKQGWVSARRRRVGVMLVNPWSRSGMTELLHHTAGRIRSRLVQIHGHRIGASVPAGSEIRKATGFSSTNSRTGILPRDVLQDRAPLIDAPDGNHQSRD